MSEGVLSGGGCFINITAREGVCGRRSIYDKCATYLYHEQGSSLALLRSCGVAGVLPVVVWYYMFCPEEESSSGDMFVVSISLS